MHRFIVKICGLSADATLEAALDAGADMVAFNFHPKSPRLVTNDAAGALAAQARGRAAIVALVVDRDDAAMDAIAAAVRPDWWQLHGSEDAARMAAISQRHGLKVIKAIGWSGERSEPDAVLALQPHVDRILLDAKPPKDAAYPGGHGKAFDWSTLSALAQTGHQVPFMLSGGLHPGNVAEAIRTVRGLGCDLRGVDVSSGVESAPGVKDAFKIRDFIAAAREAAGLS